MIGNDIIDINETRNSTNWQRNGFLEKIFDLSEIAIINASANPFLTVWTMWSMKESAYKVLLQKGVRRFFNPTKLVCNLVSLEKGKVKYDGFELTTSSEINSQYIHTTTTDANINQSENRIFQFKEKKANLQSKVTRQKLLQYISAKYHLKTSALKIEKTATRIPKAFYKNQELNVSISISHHGNYGAFTILNHLKHDGVY